MNKDLIFPTVHLNGTSRAELSRQVEEAHRALSEALGKLCEAAPNARDYYVQGEGAFGRAVAQHELRCEKIRTVMTELQAICDHFWES
jgi:hypothetical protein